MHMQVDMGGVVWPGVFVLACTMQSVRACVRPRAYVVVRAENTENAYARTRADYQEHTRGSFYQSALRLWILEIIGTSRFSLLWRWGLRVFVKQQYMWFSIVCLQYDVSRCCGAGA